MSSRELILFKKKRMKKSIILLFAIAVTSNLFSQSLKVLDTNNVDISGTEVTINGTASQGTAYFYAHIQNISSNDIQTLVCKQVIYENGLIGNSFCYGPHCYSSDTANFPVTISAGDIDSSFDASIIIANAGVSKIIYTFWDKNNSSDNVSVTVNYDIATSIEINDAQDCNYLSKPYPMPAINFINFDYNIDGPAEINIYDITGKAVLKKIITPIQNKVQIPIKNFNPGIYYYSLIMGDKKIKTDKFIVK